MDAQMEGFDFVESYPKKEFVNTARDFMGPASMYTKMGFTVYQELGQDKVIMRKKRPILRSLTNHKSYNPFPRPLYGCLISKFCIP